MSLILAVVAASFLGTTFWAIKRASQASTSLRATEGELAKLRARFAAVINVEEAAAKAKEEAVSAQAEVHKAIREAKAQLADLQAKYATGRKTYEELTSAIRQLEESLDSIDVGLYRPHFTYADSESYKRAIEDVRSQQKGLINDGSATVCATTWTVGGSQREGERMVKQTQKLILRAFNAESESAVANVTWNNVAVMQERIKKAFEMLNKHGTVLQVSITEAYMALRLKELQLVYESAEKKRQEKEEQRRQRAEQREEERVQKELLREQEDAAKEETKYAKALDKARQELQAARDEEREAMLARIKALEADVAAAHERKERALAQAQLTKVGHVYIISNLGAFGEGVVKIGMTRRLEPEERIQELGDASVPFPFDVHALIYSDNAPELETRLHNHFWDKRINWANDRKEFFRIGLSDVQAAVKELGLKSELLLVPEAREYRETVAALARAKPSGVAEATVSRFPVDPFGEAAAAAV